MDADLRDVLNRYYYDATVCDLRHLSKTGQGELSYNSVMYLDVISYQEEMLQEGCTVGSLAKTLRISNSAATMKVQELVKLGLVEKERSAEDRRVLRLHLTKQAGDALKAYDRPFERAVQRVESTFSPEEVQTFCAILQMFIDEYKQEF